MADVFQKEKLFLIAGERKTFGFDYSKHGGVRAGEALSSPSFEFVDAGSGIASSPAELIDTTFLDFDTGRKIPADKGAKVLLDASGLVVPGTYTVAMTATIGTDPAVKILGDLVVTDAGGAIP